MHSTLIQDIAGFATAFGAAFVGLQLVLARGQLKAQFEQTFVTRYETIIAHIPLDLILGDTGEVTPETRRAFYDYFELCEEELYYRKSGRMSKRTWKDWWVGIELHMRRPSFRAAWEDLRDRAVVRESGLPHMRREQFQLLREAVADLESEKPHDPRCRRCWRSSV